MKDVHYRSLRDDKYHTTLWGHNPQSHNDCPPGAHGLEKETDGCNTAQGDNMNVRAQRRATLLSQAKGQRGVEVGVEGCHGAPQKR